jgi:hypothetical protein
VTGLQFEPYHPTPEEEARRAAFTAAGGRYGYPECPRCHGNGVSVGLWTEKCRRCRGAGVTNRDDRGRFIPRYYEPPGWTT